MGLKTSDQVRANLRERQSRTYDLLLSSGKDQISAARGMACALAIMCDQDGSLVCIQDSADEKPCIVRSRPGGRWASYADLAAPQPVA
jgi:hypothetical protein